MICPWQAYALNSVGFGASTIRLCTMAPTCGFASRGRMWSLGGVNRLTQTGTVAWCFAFDGSTAVKIGSRMARANRRVATTEPKASLFRERVGSEAEPLIF